MLCRIMGLFSTLGSDLEFSIASLSYQRPSYRNGFPQEVGEDKGLGLNDALPSLSTTTTLSCQKHGG